MNNGEFDINNHKVLPGENKRIAIEVSKLPSGTPIQINAHVIRSKISGPTVLLVAGIHGDEINGIHILSQLVRNGIDLLLEKGSLIIIPLLNVYGFINFSRDVPDGKDVNRNFPGSLNGSLAARVARALTKKILPFVDYIVDLHTGGASRYNLPQIRYSPKDVEGFQLAMQFGAPVVIQKTVISKSLRKIAFDQRIPTIVFEGGESVRLDGYSIELGIKGIKKILSFLDMIDLDISNPPFKPYHITKTTWIRAKKAGLFCWTKSSGQFIKKGEILGEITNPLGTKDYKVIASESGFIIGHNNASVIHVGDALFNIGLPLNDN